MSAAELRPIELIERLEGYDPASDRSEPVRFVDLAEGVPYYGGPETGLTPVNVSAFAELAYCPYKVWHIIQGTPVVRPPRAARAVVRGSALHSARETKLLEEVAKAKPATKKQLRDPLVDLVELPEFPARFKREPWLYRARLDGLARRGGDLAVTEFKTSRYTQMPDHLLQVSAYCLASPGAMVEATDGDLRAQELSWVVEYPTIGEAWGPFKFRQNQRSLLEDALALFEATAMASRTASRIDLGWSAPASKCSPCGFAHACPWKAAPPW